MSTKIVLAVFLSVALLFISDFSFGQGKCKIKSLSRVSVNVFPNTSAISKDELTLIEIMMKRLSDHHLLASKEEMNIDYEFVLGVNKLADEDENKAIVSAVVIEKIPKEVVEIGAQGEALYKVISLEKPADITEEGQKIRELMSADYMRNFGLIESYFVEKINLKEADIFCEKVIASFLGEEKKQ